MFFVLYLQKNNERKMQSSMLPLVHKEFQEQNALSFKFLKLAAIFSHC